MGPFYLIGDLHGDLRAVSEFFIRERNLRGGPGPANRPPMPHMICVGDVGIGMKPNPAKIPKFLHKNFSFIHGNHDNPDECANTPGYLGRFGSHNQIFWVSGANSIDSATRTAGVDWFPNEEISYGETHDLLELYEKSKPEIMITHECPAVINNMRGFRPNFTSTLLDQLFSIHRPKMWFYGHHHRSQSHIIDGCIFRCLNINEIYYVDVT